MHDTPTVGSIVGAPRLRLSERGTPHASGGQVDGRSAVDLTIAGSCAVQAQLTKRLSPRNSPGLRAASESPARYDARQRQGRLAISGGRPDRLEWQPTEARRTDHDPRGSRRAHERGRGRAPPLAVPPPVCSPNTRATMRASCPLHGCSADRPALGGRQAPVRDLRNRTPAGCPAGVRSFTAPGGRCLLAVDGKLHGVCWGLSGQPGSRPVLLLGVVGRDGKPGDGGVAASWLIDHGARGVVGADIDV